MMYVENKFCLYLKSERVYLCFCQNKCTFCGPAMQREIAIEKQHKQVNVCRSEFKLK